MLLGSHLSVAEGLPAAVREARRLGLGCLQVFTRNQRQWRTKPIRAEESEAFRRSLREVGWVDGRGRLLSHASYLINIASPHEPSRRRSVAALSAEVERCEALAIERCVLHPGAHLGARSGPGVDRSVTRDEWEGIRRAARSLDEVHARTPGCRVRICLETTVGAGTTLGGMFEHLAAIRAALRQPERLAYCMDTCHMVAAGYAMDTPGRAAAVMARFDATCGLRHLAGVHVNDSKGAVGSRLDRHTHIGEGTCGESCFAAILTHADPADVPLVLETPKEGTCRGLPWDLENARRLRCIADASSPPAPPRS